MHNESDFRNLLLKSTGKDDLEQALRWRAYAQLGAGLAILLLVLVIAFSSAGTRVDEGSPAQAKAAPPAEHLRTAHAESGKEASAANVAADVRAAVQN